MIEKRIPWGLVVEGDQIFSEKTRKWYPVTGTVAIKNTTMVKVFVNGRQAGPPKQAKDMVLVRRGPGGEAVDVIQIIFSGQTVGNGVEE